MSEDPRALLLQAAEYAQAGDVDRAEAAYSALLQAAPDLAIARFQLGLLQFTHGRPATASVTWAALDALAANEPLRLFKQAFEQLAANDTGRARELLRAGIAANTANPALNRDMESLLARLEPAGESHFLVSAYKNVH